MLRATPDPADPTLPLRPIVQRKTSWATEAVCKKLPAEASRKQKVLDRRRLIAAEFIILGALLSVESTPAE
jgi:hypothetical protein